MDLFSRAYFNVFSIGAFIPIVFTGLGALLFMTIKPKSRGTRWLAASFAFLFIFNIPYFPASTIYDPGQAYHRLITVFFVLIAGMLIGQFMFRWVPVAPRWRLVPRIFLIAQTSLTVIMTVAFTAVALNAERVYHFDGHYWDFAADEISALTGVLILLYMFIFYIVGFVRSYTIKTPERVGYLWVTIGFFVATLIPGLTNILSRDGAIRRDIHQIVIDLSTIVGFFIVVVAYINTTRDRTTFMAKLVGITLATFLLVMQFVAFLTLGDRDEAYDAAHRRDTEIVLRGGDVPEDLRYRARYSLADGSVVYARKADVDLDSVKVEFANTSMREKIAALDGLSAAALKARMESILRGAHPEFAGYADYIREFVKNMPETEISPVPALLAHIDSTRWGTNGVPYQQTKIRKLKDEGFRESLIKYLNGKKSGPFAPFTGAILAHLEKSSAQGADLKAEVLGFLAPPRAAGERIYRKHTSDDRLADNFVAYTRVDREQGYLYEVGYSYLGYREFISQTAVKQLYILLAILVIVLIGFRFFFGGALLSPLETLLEGVEVVNAGELRVKVPVKVQDEIGFLAQSFNGMVESIRLAKEKLQEYADHLEEKVKERTAELRETLDTVQALKQQQDGDYFLTSLLIKPLSANHAGGKGDVTVDFLLKQKKTFQFRKWKEEIGGDLNKAHRINLKGHPYTVFLNADAMGKSMQGAGGVLVLGSVFESLIERSRMSSVASNHYPERWLKNAFIELQKVFESFNGSMLISLVVGLVDENTGIMYYINAEHPFSVLYRNGKAMFIEDELTFRKLGTTGVEGTIYVKTLQLQPGDVIIAGSDGRDDLLLGEDEYGNRIINEDEEAFLKRVEESKGELESIYAGLLEHGALTDDLSLIRVGYKDNHDESHDRAINRQIVTHINTARALRKEGNTDGAIGELERALAIDNGRPETNYDLMRLYLEKKDYARAAQFAEDYIFLRPGDTEVVYVASVCFRKAGDLERAADLGERVRLREPHMLKNLMNLCRIYMKLENYKRADLLADDILVLDPDNANATQIKNTVAERLPATRAS